MIQISRRKDIPWLFRFSIIMTSIILALIVGGVFIKIVGQSPFELYPAMIHGAIGRFHSFGQTINITISLLFLSLGIIIAFKMKFWNIGAEGQFIIGAVCANGVSMLFGNLNSYVLIPFMVIAGAIGGGLWAIIPAYFRVNFKTNETIFTLLMNYIALKLVYYLQYGLWKSKTSYGSPVIDAISDNSRLGKLFGLNGSLIIAIVFLIIVYIYINYTKKGYELNVVGESPKSATYAGINFKTTIMMNIFLSGGLCGIAGAFQLSTHNHVIDVGIANGIGYTAIITAWLSGLNPLCAGLSSFLFSVLSRGVDSVGMLYNTPPALTNVLEGLILFFVLASSFFVNFRISLKGK